MTAVPKFYHCSINSIPRDTVLVGLKAVHKGRQRVGQKLADEIFDEVRKAEFPQAPSIFTSLWVTNTMDDTIARKMFEESLDSQEAFLYEVIPLETPYRVESKWEVSACRAVTQSGLQGNDLIDFLKSEARKFWLPEIFDHDYGTYLCRNGAATGDLVHVFKREHTIR